MTTTAEQPRYVTCWCCQRQGIKMSAHKCYGDDAVTKKPNTTRYFCKNGHKFALPNKVVPA